ncbi:hypothetical protein ACH33_08535 [Aneurinibacillus sp. XH2]|uniref:hypothetical protein n=1 Tax=Aneurinibacillus sp. XH2 TaxID=1450761 RepID=UPI00070D3CAA|nr:hypothetical protein [Aneurinibacillus sp. XH2]AMA72899.1 hypothetical protein ACH33_08535 [Aneurinibacillus sp. XH2]
MNKFEIELIKLAFENYQKTGNATGVFFAKNSDEWFHYTNALEYLIEDGYAESSENTNSWRCNSNGLQISYELTEIGLNYAKTKLNL